MIFVLYVFTIQHLSSFICKYCIHSSATEGGDPSKVGTATVTVNIKNVLEFSPSTPTACIADGSTAGNVL